MVKLIVALFLAVHSAIAFITPNSSSNNRPICLTSFTKTINHHPNNDTRSKGTSPISASSSETSKNKRNNNVVEITFPTPEDAASMGIRDWPQKFYSSDWTEDVSEGQILTRYVLGGKGRVTIDYYDDDNEGQRMNQRVYPGTLVEVDGEAKLYWQVDDGKEGMIVLTPSYEDGGQFLLVLGALIVFCAGLIVGSTGL